MLLLCHRKRTSMILVSLSENSLREKNWFPCAYGAYNVRSNWRFQFEMKETHKKDEDWKYVVQNLPNLTTNFKCPTAHTDPKIFWQRPSDQVLFFKSIASQTRCLRYQLYEVVPRVRSPSQVSYVSDAVSYVSYVSCSPTQTVLCACSSYQQPLLLML